MIIVITTYGKNESIDFVRTDLFNNKSDAEEYIWSVDDKDEEKKYWTRAEIVNSGVKYEMDQEGLMATTY
tara:strand:+ start:1967 stop:2176 length:210 start_codon:yes stop_codon:yes gene_type:complete